MNGGYQTEFGWHAAFGMCCAGLIVGLINFYFMRASMAHIGSDPDAQPFDVTKLLKVLGLACSRWAPRRSSCRTATSRAHSYHCRHLRSRIFGYLIAKSHREEKTGLIAALVLTIQTIFFFIFYQRCRRRCRCSRCAMSIRRKTCLAPHLFTWLRPNIRR